MRLKEKKIKNMEGNDEKEDTGEEKEYEEENN
jgi:hypothetical protein